MKVSDVAVDAAGIVWFAAPTDQAIGRLDPATGNITMTPTTRFPRDVAIATDGQVWFTARFSPQGVGRLDPTTGLVTEFPVIDGGPQSIAAAPDGSLWFTQTTKGNIAPVTNDGVITDRRAIPMRSVLTMRLQHLIARVRVGGIGEQRAAGRQRQNASNAPHASNFGDRGGGIVPRCLRRDDGHPRREIDGRRVDGSRVPLVIFRFQP